jgi:hypothetical protein
MTLGGAVVALPEASALAAAEVPLCFTSTVT